MAGWCKIGCESRAELLESTVLAAWSVVGVGDAAMGPSWSVLGEDQEERVAQAALGSPRPAGRESCRRRRRSPGPSRSHRPRRTEQAMPAGPLRLSREGLHGRLHRLCREPGRSAADARAEGREREIENVKKVLN